MPCLEMDSQKQTVLNIVQKIKSIIQSEKQKGQDIFYKFYAFYSYETDRIQIKNGQEF